MTQQPRLPPVGSLFKDPETCDGLFARREPQPMPECAECIAFARQRNAARNSGDYSRASDINVLMRKHHAEVRH